MGDSPRDFKCFVFSDNLLFLNTITYFHSKMCKKLCKIQRPGSLICAFDCRLLGGGNPDVLIVERKAQLWPIATIGYDSFGN